MTVHQTFVVVGAVDTIAAESGIALALVAAFGVDAFASSGTLMGASGALVHIGTAKSISRKAVFAAALIRAVYVDTV